MLTRPDRVKNGELRDGQRTGGVDVGRLTHWEQVEQFLIPLDDLIWLRRAGDVVSAVPTDLAGEAGAGKGKARQHDGGNCAASFHLDFPFVRNGR
jgi:hypothetical protein